MLDRAKIGTRCREDWENMQGDARARFCGRCQKMVYNLSAMSAAEAEAILGKSEEAPPCIRFFRMSDGRVRTTDRAMPRAALTAGLLAAALVAANAPPPPLNLPIAVAVSVPEPPVQPAPVTLAGEGADRIGEIAGAIPEVAAPPVAPAPVAPAPVIHSEEAWMGDYVE